MKNKKTFVGLIIALIVGAVGNGLWEYVFEPAFNWTLTGILDIATLGVESFKEDVYREIAKGFHEKSSLTLSNTLYYWFGYGVVFGLFLFTRKTKKMVSSIEYTDNEINNLEKIANGDSQRSEPGDDINLIISNLRSTNSSLAPKVQLMHKAAYLLFVLGIAFFSWLIIGNAKAGYINSAIVHYEQSLSIVSPLTTDKELLKFKSRFARVASKDDYQSLITDLADIGDRGGLKVPEFDVW